MGLKKKSGELYVEPHHVMQVSTIEVGSLSASNVMTLCANHQRQVHYRDVQSPSPAKHFRLKIDGQFVEIPEIAAKFVGLDGLWKRSRIAATLGHISNGDRRCRLPPCRFA
jgi:hypothetical protein